MQCNALSSAHLEQQHLFVWISAALLCNEILTRVGKPYILREIADASMQQDGLCTPDAGLMALPCR